jgi:hypothetical protein
LLDSSFGAGEYRRRNDEAPRRSMMASTFLVLLIAFILDFSGLRRFAVCCLFLSFSLCVWLFLWEIHSPEYGFRMPWLQVELERVLAPVQSS